MCGLRASWYLLICGGFGVEGTWDLGYPAILKVSERYCMGFGRYSLKCSEVFAVPGMESKFPGSIGVGATLHVTCLRKGKCCIVSWPSDSCDLS